ncbi:unnamed protein product [Acanthoscelides obtectus]|uniref:Uncharacterized protein n=1 Tax=Acanthoscelides obtectus TaxID=200917 RepID=A0A9P0JSD3_ACAOB|nr:unnamed protein product [Acanthoscelides obtectus]CAK1642225.1 hypothetical protein AOBTE_LOCUS12901 [Acanthoscelides obtectus]
MLQVCYLGKGHPLTSYVCINNIWYCQNSRRLTRKHK